ncbi:MAG: hypothetical protein IPM23_08795 [Candidatus Melainabacteria bacterium]|nr:hypothetical protein [Candidatus Melainabacteria bacterium]
MTKLHGVVDALTGLMLGSLIAWFLAALTGDNAVFGPMYYPWDFGPLRGLLSFDFLVINHSGVACWVLLLASAATIWFLAIWLSRPIYRNRFFLAGLTGSLISSLALVWYCDHTQFIGVPGRVWVPAAQYGSIAWQSLKHHQNSLWTLEDEFFALKVADIVIENICFLSLSIVIPFVWARLYREDTKNNGIPKKWSPERPRMLLCGIAVLLGTLAYIAVGGVGPPDPEPEFVKSRVFVAKGDIPKGSTIRTIDIIEDTIEYLPGREVFELLWVDKNPVGKVTKETICKGQLISADNVENGERAVGKRGGRYRILYGAWQEALINTGEKTSKTRAAKAKRNIEPGETIKREDFEEVDILASVPSDPAYSSLPESLDLIPGSTSGKIRRNQILVYRPEPRAEFRAIPYLHLFADYLPRSRTEAKK